MKYKEDLFGECLIPLCISVKHSPNTSPLYFCLLMNNKDWFTTLDQNAHIHITETVKQKILPLKIVFPSHYARIYSQEAARNDIELHPDELLNSEMLSEKVVHHVINLASCTERAIIAIENEDSKTLREVLEETKQLRNELDELRKVVYEDALTKSYSRK